MRKADTSKSQIVREYWYAKQGSVQQCGRWVVVLKVLAYRGDAKVERTAARHAVTRRSLLAPCSRRSISLRTTPRLEKPSRTVEMPLASYVPPH
jgi:hypothetical protein